MHKRGWHAPIIQPSGVNNLFHDRVLVLPFGMNSRQDAMNKILIIDDSAQMLHLMREMVTIFGHQAEVAHSGSEGLEKVEAFQPELILLDLMMPEMDGWEFYTKHRALSDIPVIIVSADDSFDTRQKAKAFGVQLLEKGVKPFVLRDAIADTISNHTSATA